MGEGARPQLAVPVDDVKDEWKRLWRDRIDDKVRAEGMANQDFSLLFVEKGTVIVATRRFKPLDLKDILSRHCIENVDRFVSPHPSVGGWGKFARTVLARQSRARAWKEDESGQDRKANLQLKKGGRGWLHAGLKK